MKIVKSGPFRVRLSAEKEIKLPTVIVVLFLREKAPIKKQLASESSPAIYVKLSLESMQVNYIFFHVSRKANCGTFSFAPPHTFQDDVFAINYILIKENKLNIKDYI